MNQQIFPPTNLFDAERARMNFDDRRCRRFPVAECFDETEMKDGVVQEFFRDVVPAFVRPVRIEFRE